MSQRNHAAADAARRGVSLRAILPLLVGLIAATTMGCFGGSDKHPTISKEGAKHQSMWEECDDFLRVTYEGGPVLIIGSELQRTADLTYSAKGGWPVCVGLLREGREAKELVRDGGWGGNPFELKVRPHRNVVVTELLQNETMKTTYPFVERTISCNSTECAASRERCLLDLPRDIQSKLASRTTEILLAIKRDSVNWGISVNPSSAEDGKLDLVDELASALTLRAMLGDRKAEQMLNQPPSELNLDAAPSEIWSARLENLTRARKLGCKL
jgi:hypothetical protein